jgi:NAD(P)-dependent dehydrogenase (short-subunit alcohol dehydrogenase family)
VDATPPTSTGAALDVLGRVIATNLRGTVLTVRAVLPHLGSGAAIVTVASTAGLRDHGFGAAYTASKGAIVALTRLLALQYGPKGVRVNCVGPGATAGEGMGAIFLDGEASAPMVRDVPLRRVGQAAELGATIVALLDDSTSYVTGQIIAIDGGATVR